VDNGIIQRPFLGVNERNSAEIMMNSWPTEWLHAFQRLSAVLAFYCWSWEMDACHLSLPFSRRRDYCPSTHTTFIRQRPV